MKRILLVAAAALALTACKTDIKNGEVPNEHLSRAKQLEGVYSGSFQGRRGELKITFEGNRPVLSFTDTKGNPGLLGERCQESINDLKWVDVSRKGSINSAGFYYSGGFCVIAGDEVVLDFSNGNKTIKVSVLAQRVQERRCQWVGGGPNNPPREVCDITFRDTYYSGKFSR